MTKPIPVIKSPSPLDHSLDQQRGFSGLSKTELEEVQTTPTSYPKQDHNGTESQCLAGYVNDNGDEKKECFYDALNQLSNDSSVGGGVTTPLFFNEDRTAMPFGNKINSSNNEVDGQIENCSIDGNIFVNDAVPTLAKGLEGEQQIRVKGHIQRASVTVASQQFELPVEDINFGDDVALTSTLNFISGQVQNIGATQQFVVAGELDEVSELGKNFNGYDEVIQKPLQHEESVFPEQQISKNKFDSMTDSVENLPLVFDKEEIVNSAAPILAEGPKDELQIRARGHMQPVSVTVASQQFELPVEDINFGDDVALTATLNFTSGEVRNIGATQQFVVAGDLGEKSNRYDEITSISNVDESVDEIDSHGEHGEKIESRSPSNVEVREKTVDILETKNNGADSDRPHQERTHEVVHNMAGSEKNNEITVRSAHAEIVSAVDLDSSSTSFTQPVAAALRVTHLLDELTAVVNRLRFDSSDGKEMTIQVRRDILPETNIHIISTEKQIEVSFLTSNQASNLLLNTHLTTLQNHLNTLCPGQVVNVQTQLISSTGSSSMKNEQDHSDNDLASFDQRNRRNFNNDDDA
jgi:hypothetical protein